MKMNKHNKTSKVEWEVRASGKAGASGRGKRIGRAKASGRGRVRASEGGRGG